MNRSRFARARSLSWREWRLFAEAWLALAWLQPASRLLPFSFVERLVCSRRRLGETGPAENGVVRLVEVAVARAGHHHLWTVRCLARSFALQLLLDRRAIASELKIGVRREGSVLQAHAWVEHEGRLLADSPRIVEAYLPLEQAS